MHATQANVSNLVLRLVLIGGSASSSVLHFRRVSPDFSAGISSVIRSLQYAPLARTRYLYTNWQFNPELLLPTQIATAYRTIFNVNKLHPNQSFRRETSLTRNKLDSQVAAEDLANNCIKTLIRRMFEKHWKLTANAGFEISF